MDRTKDLLFLFVLLRRQSISLVEFGSTWHQFLSSPTTRPLVQIVRERTGLSDFKIQQHIEEVVGRVERHAWSEADALAELLRETSPADQALLFQYLSNPPETVGLVRKNEWEVRYRRDEIVGKGGVGVVWRATDLRSGRHVAIKNLRDGILGRQKDLDRFQAEARISACLEHPNIIPIYDLWEGKNPDDSGYCMRLLGQQTLKDAIEAFHSPTSGKSDSLAFSKLLETILEVCKGIEYAHSRGVIHRDLKPANIAIGEFGEVIILDWGLAKVLRPDEAFGEVVGTTVTTTTGLRGIVGTPAYMAPEQAWGKPSLIGPAADVYALGGILFHLLTGRPPRLKKTEVSLRELVEEIATTPVPSPRSIDDRIFPKLDAICRRAMSHFPHERFTSAAEFADELRRYQNGQPLQTYRERWMSRSRRWMLSNRVVTVTAFSSALFTIVSASLLFFLFRFADQTLVEAKTQQLTTLLNSINAAFEFQQGRIQTVFEDLHGDVSLHAVLTGRADSAETQRVTQRLANQFSARKYLLDERILPYEQPEGGNAATIQFPANAPAEGSPLDPTEQLSKLAPKRSGSISCVFDIAPASLTRSPALSKTLPVLHCQSTLWSDTDTERPVGNVALTATLFPLSTADDLPTDLSNSLLFCSPEGIEFAAMSWANGQIETKSEHRNLQKVYPELLSLLQNPSAEFPKCLTVDRPSGPSVVALQRLRSPKLGLTTFVIAEGPLDRVSHHQLAPMFVKIALTLSAIALISTFFVAYLLSSPLLPADSPRRSRSLFRRTAPLAAGQAGTKPSEHPRIQQ